MKAGVNVCVFVCVCVLHFCGTQSPMSKALNMDTYYQGKPSAKMIPHLITIKSLTMIIDLLKLTFMSYLQGLIWNYLSQC